MNNNYQAWITSITQEINQKYTVESPEFIFDDLFENDYKRKKYLQDALTWPFWLKYRYVQDSTFELKSFAPDPTLKICEKIIDDFFRNFYSSVKAPHEKITFTIFGDCTYSEKEMRRELLYLVRTGNPKIEVKNGPVQDEEDILYTLAAQPDTLENMLKSGYLTLEYSND